MFRPETARAGFCRAKGALRQGVDNCRHLPLDLLKVRLILPAMSFRSLLATLSILTLLLGKAAVAAPLSEPLKLSYDAYAGPFYVMSATVELVLEDGRYRIVTNGKTEGFAAWMFSWTNQTVSEGTRENGMLTPSRHRVESHWGDKDRRVRLRYEDKRPVVEELLPGSDGGRRDSVPEKLVANTIDPLTMTASLVLGMAKGGACQGDFRVFDGRRRYDLAVIHGVTDDLEEESSSIYSGEAQSCSLRLNRIAGFWKKETKIAQPLQLPTLWMGRPGDNGPPVPVKFEAYSSYGTLRILLTRFEMGDEVVELEKD